jgi:hypothetical protein
MLNVWMTIWNNAVRGFATAFLPCGLVALILVFAAPNLSWAKTQALTQDTVKQFIASFPAVKAIAVSHAVEKGKAIASTKDNLAAVIAAVSDKSVADRVNKAVKPHGFKDAKEWSAVAQSVGQVYAHLKLGTADGRAKKKLDKAIDKIEKNDFLNDKQKQQLVKALRSGADEALEPPSEENVKAVKPMVAELEAVVN